jgi:SAM-dependent methyltransferase
MSDANVPDLESRLAKIAGDASLPAPPNEEIYTGGSIDNFREIGVAILRSLIAYGLQPGYNVLEIGSGIGRVAIPLTQWLSGDGRYTGVEIVKRGVDWCKQNISTNYPNFQFIYLDLENNFYNPSGGTSLNELPLPDAGFDVALFASVFTHLHQVETDRYIELMARYIKPGGLFWSTWFLIEEGSKPLIHQSHKTSIMFTHQNNAAYYQNKDESTSAVAFDRNWVISQMEKRGFVIKDVLLGKWCERLTEYGGYQDLIVCNRRP